MLTRSYGVITRLGVITAIAIGFTTGCADLDVVNLNEPDRERALAEPGDLEALIAGAFGIFFGSVHDANWEANLFPNCATEFTSNATNAGTFLQCREPRVLYDNSTNTPRSSGPMGPRDFWRSMAEAAASGTDGLRLIGEREITFTEGNEDVTPRALAFAKFSQGLGWGYTALFFDQVVVVADDDPVDSDPVQQAVSSLMPRDEALALAIEKLEEAKTIALQHDISFPSFSQSRLWFATPEPLNSGDFARLVNTLIARYLVLSARNPEERRSVDWNRVLQYTEEGVTTDFETVLAPGFRSSLLYSRAQANPAGCTSCYRWDYRVIGLADVSGAYQAWIGADIGARDRFDIETPDRRITGPSPQSAGAYTVYRADDNGFPAGLGLYFRSAYQWARHAHRGFLSNTGTARMITVDENNLLRAEALLRTGDLEGAAELINVTRTRSHTLPDGVTYPGLPPVTAEGAPQSDDCVPRTDAGGCGDLMVALRYERMLELAGTDAVRGYWDSRGFGLLPEGSWVQLPVSGNELEVLGLPNYSFGGVGGEWSATYAPVTMEDL